jgi:hypothetical protein
MVSHPRFLLFSSRISLISSWLYSRMPPIWVKERVPVIRRFWSVPGEMFRSCRTSFDFNHFFCGCLEWPVEMISLISLINSILKLWRSSIVIMFAAMIIDFVMKKLLTRIVNLVAFTLVLLRFDAVAKEGSKRMQKRYQGYQIPP